MAAPYERIKQESSPAFDAFVAYRDMGPERSLAAVAQKVGKSKALMERWSVRNNWVERAAEWDAHLDQRRREAQAREAEKMAERHARISMRALDLVARRLEELEPTQVPPTLIPRLLDAASKLERISRGEATERVETQAPATDEEVRAFLAGADSE